MEVPVTTEEVAPAPAHTIVGVRFMPVGKIYHFDATRVPDVRVDDWVVVNTARGKQLGQVAAINPPRYAATDGPLKAIERLASNRDLALKKYWETQEVGAMVLGREKAHGLALPLKIIKAEYTFDGQRIAFLYVLDEGIDVCGAGLLGVEYVIGGLERIEHDARGLAVQGDGRHSRDGRTHLLVRHDCLGVGGGAGGNRRRYRGAPAQPLWGARFGGAAGGGRALRLACSAGARVSGYRGAGGVHRAPRAVFQALRWTAQPLCLPLLRCSQAALWKGHDRSRAHRYRALLCM